MRKNGCIGRCFHVEEKMHAFRCSGPAEIANWRPATLTNLSSIEKSITFSFKTFILESANNPVKGATWKKSKVMAWKILYHKAPYRVDTRNFCYFKGLFYRESICITSGGWLWLEKCHRIVILVWTSQGWRAFDVGLFISPCTTNCVAMRIWQ